MREGRPKGERTRWSCPTGEGGDKGCKISPGQHVVDGSFQGIPKSCKDFFDRHGGGGGGSDRRLQRQRLAVFFFFLAQRRKWKSEHEVSTPFSLPLPFPLFFLHPCFSPLPLFFLLLSASSRHRDSTPLGLGCPGNGAHTRNRGVASLN